MLVVLVAPAASAQSVGQRLTLVVPPHPVPPVTGAPPPAGVLPRTGAPFVALMVVVGLSLVVLGAMVLVGDRWRRRAAAPQP